MNKTDNNHITITLGFYKKKCHNNILIKNCKTGSHQFEDLQTAISSLNQFIEEHDIHIATSIDILFGKGITWVNPKNKRTYYKQVGDKYFPEPLVMPIGRKKTVIIRLTIGGFGQGVSTVIGSWLGLVYNLQQPKVSKEDYINCDQLQLTNRLVINNVFWEGPFGLNVVYSNSLNTQYKYFQRPHFTNNLDYYNPNKNKYQYTDKWKSSSVKDQIEVMESFIAARKVEVIISNVWVEMALPNPQIVSKPLSINFPLFFLNLPVYGRIFMVQSNITTYLRPDKMALDYGITQWSSQFVNPTPPVDVFIQTSSFSTRIFGEINYSCLYLSNLEKVSILDSQLNGQLVAKCNSLTLFGCYILAIGSQDPLSNNPYPSQSTTPGVTWLVPDMLGYPKSSRFIQSSCEYVGMANNWKHDDKEIEINNYSEVCDYLKSNALDKSKYRIAQKVLPWRTESWVGQTPSIFFSNISFYIVNTQTAFRDQEHHFNLITLSNGLGECRLKGTGDNNTVIFRARPTCS